MTYVAISSFTDCFLWGYCYYLGADRVAPKKLAHYKPAALPQWCFLWVVKMKKLLTAVALLVSAGTSYGRVELDPNIILGGRANNYQVEDSYSAGQQVQDNYYRQQALHNQQQAIFQMQEANRLQQQQLQQQRNYNYVPYYRR